MKVLGIAAQGLLLFNQQINHIETKEILGDTDMATINTYFYSEAKEIYRLEIVITSEKTKTEVVYYKIVKEKKRKMIYNRADGRCQLCGKKILYKEMNVDHIVPLAMNGSN